VHLNRAPLGGALLPSTTCRSLNGNELTGGIPLELQTLTNLTQLCVPNLPQSICLTPGDARTRSGERIVASVNT
jgi:hypothetical protein